MAEAALALVERVRLFLFTHRIRIGACLVLAACAAIITNADPSARSVWIVILLPVVIATLVPIGSQAVVTQFINGWGNVLDRRQIDARGRTGKVARYFLQPLFGGSVRIWSWSESSITDSHLKAGARVAALLYLWAAMILALILAAYIAVVIVVIVAMVAFIGWALSQSGSASEASSDSSRRSASFFSTACAHCGSTEHASSDCPHGMFSSECSHCGSKNHASDNCPHGMFSSECSHCGSKDHTSSDCPHGMFSSECSHCGSKSHSSGDCPHGMFASACSYCGSKDHSTDNCPH